MPRKSRLLLKRAVDVAGAAFLLTIAAPVIAASALAIAIDSRGPVFFKLRAAGMHGKVFHQWKLRTMVDGAQITGHRYETSANDPRITRVGRMLRRWSIDELPQLWNILCGEMSLVGPRPTFAEIAAAYSAEQMERLKMRPGLTGLAQIHGRNLLPWAERVELDKVYVREYSLWLDGKIIVRTVPAILRGKGIYGEDGAVRMQDVGQT